MRLHNKIAGAVWWWALGDSLWISVETKTRLEIQEQFGEVTNFLPLKTNKFFASGQNKKTFTWDLESSGYISDDTILTLAWLQSLINKRSLDLYDLFNEHNKFVEKFGPAGFGKGTLASLWKIKSGYNPLDAGQNSRGNGVMMKQFPYALYFHLYPASWRQTDKKIDDIARCTHLTPVARLTAIIHNRMLLHLLAHNSTEEIHRFGLLDALNAIATEHEQSLLYTEGDRTEDETISVAGIIKKLQDQYDAIQSNKPYSLEKIIETYTVKWNNSKAKYGFHVATTFGFVYSIFLQNQNRQGLLDAINIGEDTDTQAAIIGNMIGAFKGEFYDKALILQLKDQQEISGILDSTIRTFLK